MPLLDHRAHHSAAESEHRLEIGVDHGIPVRVLHAHGQIVSGDASVVHQHVQDTMLLEKRVQGRVDAGRVIHIEARSLAAGIASQGLIDGTSTGLGRGGSDHDQAATGQFQRDRSAYASRCARDQSDFTDAVFCFVHDSRFLVSSKDAGSKMAPEMASASMRFIIPARTLPGPHSTRCETPMARMARMVSDQRTGPNA